MVIILERNIQRIVNGKLGELEELDSQFDEIEIKIGYPPKKRFLQLTGSYDTQTTIIERQWESLAKMEKLMTKAVLDPEYQKLMEKLIQIVEWQKIELLVPYPPFPT